MTAEPYAAATCSLCRSMKSTTDWGAPNDLATSAAFLPPAKMAWVA